MMSSISGSYSGIMGLPLFETGQLLRSFGFKL
jgi:septum formation protein